MSSHSPRGVPPRSAEDVYAIIQAMTRRERYVLFSVLASAPFREVIFDTGFIVVSDDETASLIEGMMVEGQESQSIIDQLKNKLSKHRKPKKNAERDAEIMRLHDAGKTAGQIDNALADRWQLTDKRVNAVISRENRKRRSHK